ncbi:hypothetical protein M0R45_019971 [Rubus argutus]|uniref:Uncharacterized protein n=1 Tax=Rubus argutus TaxID=59490 RepID=A0AAW1XAD3_RUBAR
MVAVRRSKVQDTRLVGGERTSGSRRTRTMKETLSLKHRPIFAQSKPSYLLKPNHSCFFLYSKKLRVKTFSEPPIMATVEAAHRLDRVAKFLSQLDWSESSNDEVVAKEEGEAPKKLGKMTDLNKILSEGPIVIGQACQFSYSGTDLNLFLV